MVLNLHEANLRIHLHRTLIQQPYLLLLLPFLLLLFTFHRRQQPTLNLPPGPRPLPIIGNLHNLGNLPHISFHLLSKKYGPIMHLTLGRIPTIVISAADTASEILKSQDHIFCSRSLLTSLKRFSYGGKGIAFSPFDDHWKQVRRLSTAEIFSLGRVQSFHSIRREEVDVLLNNISKACFRGETVKLSEMLLCFFNNIICREVFGQRISAEGECGSSSLQDLLREVVTVLAEFGAGDLFPSMEWIDVLTGWRRKLDMVFGKMDFIFDEKIKERVMIKDDSRQRQRDSNCQEDFLDVLLRLQAKEDHPSLTMNEIKAILMDMFVAGTDTSAAVIEWGMTQLMKNPKIMTKAQEEVRRVVGDKGWVEESDLQHLHYLRLIIKETLRLNPPGPLLPPRECMKDTKINGYDVRAKTRVYVNVWSIGRDPKYWDDPEIFRPERFQTNSINFKGNYFELIPFGGGRRICPGMTLAMVSVELVFASIIYGFDWVLPDGMTKESIDMSVASGLITPKKLPLILVAKTTLNK